MFASPSPLRAALFVFVASTTAACSSNGSYSSGAVAPRDETVVSVTNRNWADIKVYAVRGGSRYRLGSVTSFTSANLRLPRSITMASDFRIRVELIGSPEVYLTDVLYVRGGARVDLVVNSHLALSHLAIR